MSATALRVVLYEGAGSAPFDAVERFDVTRALLEKGYRVTRAGGAAPAASIASASPLVVLGRFDDAPPAEAVSDGGAPVYFRNVRGQAVDAMVAMVDETSTGAGTKKPGGWKPWFPVIDYSRCTNCMQCLTFCLFDVYGVSGEKKIQVQKPTNCKTDCPACSRVCPEVAILFPKYKAGPINGDEVNAADLEREKMKVDISALLGGDIYAALRQRSQHAQSRFAKERDDARALEERKRCLTKLQQALDIPPEVLGALPSLDDIRERTARAVAQAAPAPAGNAGDA